MTRALANEPPPYDPLGLSGNVALERLRLEGPNELPEARRKTLLDLILQVLREPMLLLLLASGVVYLLLGSTEEAVALLTAILLIIGITLYQERNTERTLQALRDLSSPRALVIREGQRIRIPGREVVRGDLVVLSEGDRIPADALVVSSVNLMIDESLLTGESLPVRKSVWDGRIPMPRPGGEEIPAVFSSTLVVQGSGLAIVQSTGSQTEIGKLGRSLQSIQIESTAIEKETGSLVRVFATVSLVLCAVVVAVYALARGEWLRGLLAGLALAISLIPEEFPVVLTLFLAIGARRISRKQVLTRRVSAIEMLGEATVLCVDKTGTLTMNRMTVVAVAPSAAHDRAEVLQAAMYASSDNPVDPMEKAFHEAARASATVVPHPTRVLVREYPLSRELLTMSRVLDAQDQRSYEVFTKGAPEAVAQLCGIPMSDISPGMQTMAERGLRVLGVARTSLPKSTLPDSQSAWRGEFLGLVGLEDPVRPSVPEAIRECYTAGIRVVMITGDYAMTANSIAAQAGLNNSGSSITGTDIQKLTAEELSSQVRGINIFARVLPEQKLRLVEALKANGEIVAMTGDGVNDAPALKAAHIGIAMGGRGTDVAREAASLVLLDDDFSSIVAAIRLGRRIYDNLQKAMTYILAIHVPIAGMALVPVLFGLPLVLFPLHIVFLELVIDPACSVAFESEPEHPEIMKRPPRNPNSRMFSKATIFSALAQGFGLLIITLAAFLTSLYRGQGELDARAISFTTLVLGNLALIWANRSRTRTILEILRIRNVSLIVITGATLVLLAAVLYVPSLRDLFQFSTLHANDVAICIVLALLTVTWIEVRKLRARSRVPRPEHT
jgi:Ca2+-transporting ATPase